MVTMRLNLLNLPSTFQFINLSKKKQSNNFFNVNFRHQGGTVPKVMATVESGSLRCFNWYLGKLNQTYSFGVINR